MEEERVVVRRLGEGAALGEEVVVEGPHGEHLGVPVMYPVAICRL